MHPFGEAALTTALRDTAHALSGSLNDYDPLLSLIGDADFVLLGEATHGTHEFYSSRAEITRRLITEKGFNAIAVEADWPDAYRVNRFVRGRSGDRTALDALSGFDRFPTWMWRNSDVLSLINWLRTYNVGQSTTEHQAGFYGLDVYSLHGSIEAVEKYLEGVDPEAARVARQRYSCFDHFRLEPQEYGWAAHTSLIESCEDDVVRQLMDLQRKSTEYLQAGGIEAEDEYFFAEQNARIVQGAEAYYRIMYRAGSDSWNHRDRHMASTLDALARHLSRRRRHAKVVVWAHNSHLGDARATQVAREGELNLGQLVAERYGERAVLVGFTTFSGSVTAADEWGEPPRHTRLAPALPESYESLFHRVGLPRFLLDLRDLGEAAGALNEERLERMIGVIYKPRTERWSHYVRATLPKQFDAIIHVDHTSAVHPLDRHAAWSAEEPPETYPSAL